MKKMMNVVFLASTLAMSAHAADSYTIDPFHTYPVFKVNHFGFSNQIGRFNKSSGNITLDYAAKSGNVELVIDTTSIDMGFPLWDEHMSAEKFFNVAKFPTITFKSSKLIFKDGKVVGGEGQITIKGVSKPLSVTVSDFNCAVNPINKKPTCGANVSAKLKRSDFGMKEYLPAVGDDVEIVYAIEATKN